MAIKSIEQLLKEQKNLIKEQKCEVLNLQLKLLAIEIIRIVKNDLTLTYNENKLSIDSNNLSDIPFYITIKIDVNKFKVISEGNHESKDKLINKIYKRLNIKGEIE